MWRKQSKYRNKRAKGADGTVYASKHERARYPELLLLERAGKISNIQRQVKYQLLPPQRGADGKIVERGVDYIADFVYTTADGLTIVEDAKGVRTKDYIIKRKLMLYIYGIKVVEV